MTEKTPSGEHNGMISIWFFIGILLFIYGLLIGGAGIYDYVYPAAHPVVLSQLHAGLWWGILLTVLGAGYAWRFSPSKTR